MSSHSRRISSQKTIQYENKASNSYISNTSGKGLSNEPPQIKSGLCSFFTSKFYFQWRLTPLWCSLLPAPGWSDGGGTRRDSSHRYPPSADILRWESHLSFNLQYFQTTTMLKHWRPSVVLTLWHAYINTYDLCFVWKKAFVSFN